MVTSSGRGPYSRVYHSIIDDPKFATVYDDDQRLATWLRLLMAAEQAYPASAYVPQGTDQGALAELVDVGLIDLGNGSRYRVHGLASEREQRSESARNAAAVRWHGASNAEPMLEETRREETRRDEIPPPPTRGGRRKAGTNPRAVGTSPRQNGHAPRDEGTSTRQERQRQKTGPTALGPILRDIAEH